MTRQLKLLLLILVYIKAGLINQMITWDPVKKRWRAIRLTSWASRIALRTFNAQVKLEGIHAHSHPKQERVGRLIVCNHLSYIDILVMSSLWPGVFVTSVETEQSPFIGLVSKLGGSLFVERRNKTRLKADIETIAQVIKQGFDVIIFPEGTSGNGEGLLPFKKSLLTSAVGAETEVVPMCLNYTHINNEKPSKQNRDTVFYYGDMNFGPHFGRALKELRTFGAQIQVLEPIPTNRQSCRKEIAMNAFIRIQNHFKPIEYPPQI